jgi:hypothetical protein
MTTASRVSRNRPPRPKAVRQPAESLKFPDRAGAVVPGQRSALRAVR